MSTTNAAGNTASSTLSQITGYAVESGKWAGRQVQWLFNTFKDFAVKVIDYVRPFFASVARLLGEQFAKVKEFVVANKELVGVSAVSLFVGGLLFLGAFQLCSGETSPTPQN